jgi:hypothetical protein
MYYIVARGASGVPISFSLPARIEKSEKENKALIPACIVSKAALL